MDSSFLAATIALTCVLGMAQFQSPVPAAGQPTSMPSDWKVLKSVTLAAALLWGGCTTAVQKTALPTQSPQTAPAVERYPELELFNIYDTVTNAMAGKVFDPRDTEGKKKNAALVAYIRKAQPPSQFETTMVDNHDILKKGHTDLKLRDTADYERDKSVVVSVAVQMAMLIGSNAIDVYCRKYASPDNVTAPLFAKSSRFEDDLIIAWLGNEVTADELKKNVKGDLLFGTELRQGDKVYSYSSPPFSWEQLFGRSGYAVFRDGKLVGSFCTTMN